MIGIATANPKELAAQLTSGQSLSFISYSDSHFLINDRVLATSRGLQAVANAKRRIKAPSRGVSGISLITGEKGYYHAISQGLADTFANEVLWHVLRSSRDDLLPVLFTGVNITVGGAEKLATVIYTIDLGGSHG